MVVAIGLAGCSVASSGPATSSTGPAAADAGQAGPSCLRPAESPGSPAGPSAGSPSVPPPGPGAPLPELTLPCLDGAGNVALAGLTGVPTVVNLWASWCGPCRQEIPAFQRLHEAAGGRLRVLGVATEDSDARARSFATDAGVTYPSVADPTGRLRRALGRQALPVTVFVTAAGRIGDVYNSTALTDATLRRLVRDRLGVAV